MGNASVLFELNFESWFEGASGAERRARIINGVRPARAAGAVARNKLSPCNTFQRYLGVLPWNVRMRSECVLEECFP